MTLLVAVAVVSTGVAVSQKTDRDTASSEDKKTFEAVCGTCHTSDMVNEIRTKDDWNATVHEMAKIGAKGTDEQFERVRRYLLRNWTKVNVNTAPALDIAAVLDVSDATAEAIVKRRNAKGDFKTLDDLKAVPGVDPVKLAARKDRIAF